MGKAFSLHIGLNKVDPEHYGSECPLAGCINDANAMKAIAVRGGFKPEVFTNEGATSEAIFDYLVQKSRELLPGDTLFVTFAGHGALTADENNDEISGGMDQTWCAYDRMIVDDELAEHWANFQPGVRIILVSDSCHSATVARAMELISRSRSALRDVRAVLPNVALIGDNVGGNPIAGFRTLPEVARRHIIRKHTDFYSSIQEHTLGSERTVIKATLISLSACRDDETAADGEKNGLYTSTLLSVLNKGAFRGTYSEFQSQIATAIGDVQRPQFRRFGTQDEAFEAEQPFTFPGGGETYPLPSPDCSVHMSLKIPQAYLDSLPQEEVEKYLRSHGADMVLKAIYGAHYFPSANGGSASGAEVDLQYGNGVKISMQF